MSVDRSWDKLAELQTRNWDLNKHLAAVEFTLLELRSQISTCEAAMSHAVTAIETLQERFSNADGNGSVTDR
jgi:chromosome segregation ATPase